MNFDILHGLCDKYDITTAEDYGEPGYSLPNPNGLVLLANWNNIPEHIAKGLERRGFATEWSDEWLVDYEHDNKAYRTRPDSYSWTPSFHIIDCDVWTLGSATDCPDAYLEAVLESDDQLSLLVDPADHGFTKVNDDTFESGFYGTADSPEKILEAVEVQYPDHDILFGNLTNEQFRQNWDVFVRPRKD